MNSGGRGKYQQRGFIQRNAATTPYVIEGTRGYHDVCVAPTQDNRACNSPADRGASPTKNFFFVSMSACRVENCHIDSQDAINKSAAHRQRPNKCKRIYIHRDVSHTSSYYASVQPSRKTQQTSRRSIHRGTASDSGKRISLALLFYSDDDVLTQTPLRPFRPPALKKYASIRSQTRAPSMGKFAWWKESRHNEYESMQHTCLVPVCVNVLEVIQQWY